MADDAALRGRVRKIYEEEATVSSKIMYGKEEEAEAQKFRDYFEWSEPFKSIPSHRMLAIRRGEKEAFLLMRVEVPLERVTSQALPEWVKSSAAAGQQVALAVEDGCKRLLMPSMETEARLLAKKRADDTAISVFAENLRELLLASPLGEKRLFAIDPGFRTGCKTVVLDRSGKLLHHTVLHATAGSNNQLYEAAVEVTTLVKKHDIEAIAIGNGTGSRETEAFIKKLKLPSSIPVVMVNESGASIYSASEVAREEFPNEDVTVRGAVSIGRRLMDPLAELVKIDPKSIGVGQYQHDVDQRALKNSLDDTVDILRQRRRRGTQHRLQTTALLCLRPQCHARRKHRRLSATKTARSPPASNSRKSHASATKPSNKPPDSCASAAASTRSMPPPSTRSATPSSSAWPGTSAASVDDLLASDAARKKIDLQQVRQRRRRPAHACRTSSANSPSPAATRANSSSSSPSPRAWRKPPICKWA